MSLNARIPATGLPPRRRNGLAPGCWVAVWLFLATLAALAQPATNSPGTKDTAASMAGLQAKLAEAKADYGRAQSEHGNSTNLPPGATASEALEYRLALQSLVRIYQDHLDDLAGWQAVQQRQQDFAATAKTWTGFAEPPPYSVLLVDELRDARQSLTSKIRASETALDILDSFIAEAKTGLRDSDGRLRLLNEQLEAAKDPAQVARLTWQRALAQVRHRVAAANAASRETQRRTMEAELAEHQARLAFTQRQLALAATQVGFPQAVLDQVLDSLDRQRRLLDHEYGVAETDKETQDLELAKARTALAEALQAPAETGTNASTRAAAIRRLEEVVQVRGVQAETCSQRLRVLRQLGTFLNTERGLWQLRFAAAQAHDLATLQQAYQRLERLQGMVATGKPFFTQQIEAAANQFAAEQNRLENQAVPAADAGLARELLDSYQQREGFYQRGLRSLEKSERLVVRWQESLNLDRQALPVTERVRDVFSDAAGVAAKLWNFELFAVDDTIVVDGQKITGRRGVTVGKIALAVLILVVGYWLTGWLSRIVEPIAVRRLKIEPNQASLIRRWVRVVLVLCLVVFSLVSVKIPLTVFAFAGGALAIGIGFGTQNLLKNFISGIIILFERPFRVGDVLDVAGQRGTVTGIGIRSCVIMLWDGTETLIPNSALLENNVTNWTYSNRTVRFTLSVGVAYGSDTRRAAQLLAEIAERHGLVQKSPKPQVLFMDFADSALTFELRYWVDVLAHNAAQIASDLRHMIAGTFAEHGIAIAFPQRDVHLDTTRPLQVQIVPPPASDPAPAAPGEKPVNVLPG
jgi:potassium efflux system protein